MYHRTLFGKPQCHLIGLPLCGTLSSSWLGAPLTCSKAQKRQGKTGRQVVSCLFFYCVDSNAKFTTLKEKIAGVEKDAKLLSPECFQGQAYGKLRCVVGPPFPR